MGKILVGEKLVNRELIAKVFLANIRRYTENVFGICTDYSLFIKLFLANSFYRYGSPKFSHAKSFLCTMKNHIKTLYNYCNQVPHVRNFPVSWNFWQTKT